MGIKTNKLLSNINFEVLTYKYDLFVVSTSDAYFKGGASVLDVSLLENNIQAVLFERGKSFYVMMLADSSNKVKLKNALQKCDEKTTVSFSQIKWETVDEPVILQLLINGLGSVENEILRFNNLTGHLYCFHPEWIRRGRQGATDCIWKVPCLEVKISKENMLSLSVRTFTSVSLKKKISFTKKRFEDYPQYVFSDRNTLRRKLKIDTEPAFILRQTDNAKTEIPFLDIQNLSKFRQSKMGVLHNLLQEFNQKYSGLCSVELASFVEEDCIDHKRKDDRVQAEAIRRYLQTQNIRIVDMINDDYSEACCKSMEEMLNVQYGISSTVGKRPNKNALNIALIHNAEYYIDNEDPYNAYGEYVIQHITLEDFHWDSKFAMDSVIHELIIKQDIQGGRISLFDWKAGGFSKLSFGLKECIDDIDRYFFMDINPDGTFSFSEQELDLFNLNDYYRCVSAFEDAKTNGDNVIGLIRLENGNMNLIKDTDWITIPEIDTIYGELQSGNNKLRGKESRSNFLAASIDIKSFRIPDRKGVFYFVGDIGEGMRYTVQRAANIRNVVSYDNSSEMFIDLLPLMDVGFVRNGQLTVMPFPFKYLREYVRTI